MSKCRGGDYMLPLKSMSPEFLKCFLFRGEGGSKTGKPNISFYFRHSTLCTIRKGDGHLESKSAQRLVLLKLLVLLINIYMVDVKYKHLSCQRKSSKSTSNFRRTRSFYGPLIYTRMYTHSSST